MTLKLTLPPGSRLSAVEVKLVVNSWLLLVMEETASGALPMLRILTGRLERAPVRILPKFRLAGVTSITGRNSTVKDGV